MTRPYATLLTLSSTSLTAFAALYWAPKATKVADAIAPLHTPNPLALATTSSISLILIVCALLAVAGASIAVLGYRKTKQSTNLGIIGGSSITCSLLAISLLTWQLYALWNVAYCAAFGSIAESRILKTALHTSLFDAHLQKSADTLSAEIISRVSYIPSRIEDPSDLTPDQAQEYMRALRRLLERTTDEPAKRRILATAALFPAHIDGKPIYDWNLDFKDTAEDLTGKPVENMQSLIDASENRANEDWSPLPIFDLEERIRAEPQR